MQGEIDLKRFKKLKRLSGGSFGFVYQIQDKKTGKFYAAKIINCKDNEAKCAEMVNREVSILMYTNHPTIIKFIGYSKIDFHNENNVTIIMDLAKNGSLREVLRQIQQNDGPKNYTNTIRQIILVGIARGIKYLHDRNIIHRDIKPENILLDENFQPHITDFGLSKFFKFDDSSIQTKFGGTLIYEAPEILKEQKYNRKVDVYAFGILMFEVLTDSVPYPELLSGKMPEYEFMTRVIRKRYRPKFSVPIKSSLRELIEQCWSEKPSDRPTFDEIFNKLANKTGIEDEEENFLLDDVDTNELNMYVEDITEITDGTEKLLNQISKLNEENRQLKIENKNQSNKIKALEENNERFEIEKIRHSNESKILKEKNRHLSNELKRLSDENKILEDNNRELRIDNKKKLSQLKILEEDKRQLNEEIKKQLDTIKALEEDKRQLNEEIKKQLDTIKALEEDNKQLNSEIKVLSDTNRSLEEYINRSPKSDRSKNPKIISKIAFDKLSEACQTKVISAELNEKDSIIYVAQGFLEGTNGFPRMIKYGKDYLKYGVKIQNVEAMQLYGQYKLNGTFFKKNEEKGIYILHEAATLINSSDRLLHLVEIILSKQSFDVRSTDNNNVNFPLAKKYCKEAADLGNTKAMVLYGKLCMKEKKSKHFEINSDFKEAFKYFRQAADNGDGEGLAFCGRFLEYGYGIIKPNKRDAFDYYKASFDKRDMTGYAFYGSALIEGVDGVVPINEEEGIRLIKISCDHQNPYGMANYGYFLSKGISRLKKNESQSLYYYKMAAEAGCPVAFSNLGVCYRERKGIEKDVKLAAKYFKMAIEEGYPRSALLLGHLLINGDKESSFKTDIKEGFKYIQYAAEHGNETAMYMYARNMYYQKDVEMNTKLLKKYLLNGIECGHTGCMRLYGKILINGDVLPEDRSQGISFIKMAADLGDVKAMELYARVLGTGDGVLEIEEKADEYEYMAM